MVAWQNMHLNQMRGIMHFIYLQHIKNDRPKYIWHIWQVRRVRLIDPLFISKTTVSLWQHSKETTFKLVQSSVSSPRINSFRVNKGHGKVFGLWHKLCVQARMHTHTHTHKPHTPTHPFVDLIEYRIKTRRFFKNGVSPTVRSTSQRGRQREKKGKAKLSLSPRSVRSCLNKSRRSPKKYLST